MLKAWGANHFFHFCSLRCDKGNVKLPYSIKANRNTEQFSDHAGLLVHAIAATEYPFDNRQEQSCSRKIKGRLKHYLPQIAEKLTAGHSRLLNAYITISKRTYLTYSLHFFDKRTLSISRPP